MTAAVCCGGADVRVLTLDEQLAGLVAGRLHLPFAVTIRMGAAGASAARGTR